MRRHHEKRRDMARSILPSKNREAARTALALDKRASRHGVRQDLRTISPSVGPDPDDDGYLDWDERAGLRRYPDVVIGQTVRRRQQGDKLGPFMRWARNSTADLPLEARIPTIERWLPDGPIGRHAVSHLEREPGLAVPHEHDTWPVRARWREHAHEAQARRPAAIEEVRVLLRALLADGCLGRLNRSMKQCDRHWDRALCEERGCVRRCLAGHHDIDEFLDVVLRPSRRRRDWRRPADDEPSDLPVRRFRAYVEQHHPDHLDALAAARWSAKG